MARRGKSWFINKGDNMSRMFGAVKGSRLTDSKAQIYGTEIYNFMKRMGKKDVEAGDLVKDAERSEAPYHSEFEWNNTKAGHGYRLDQARALMRGIVTFKSIGGKEEPVRTFHFVSVSSEVKSYVPQEVVFKSRTMSDEIIGQAISEATNWYKKYSIYQELSGLSKAIKKELELVS